MYRRYTTATGARGGRPVEDHRMNLVNPTDFEVLAFLDARGRNNAINIAAGLGRDRSYINTRLRQLAQQGLVERVGPAPNSGLYEITELGRTALEHRDAYRDPDRDFEALVERSVSGC